MEPQEPVTLVSMADGAAVELFDRMLEDALRNIQDVNTPPKAKRTITIKVEITPDEDRTLGNVSVSASTKFPSINTVNTKFFMGKIAGKPAAVESNPQQMGLFGKPGANVVQMAAVTPTPEKES